MWLAVISILASLLTAGVLIGACLGLVGILILHLSGSGLAPAAIATWNLLYNFSLSALPLYIFLGEVFVVSGLAGRGYNAIAPLLERFPGKLLLSNVILDAMFGAIVGTSMATAATVGAIAYPELSKRGYNKRALIGNLAGAGTLGSFIPPGIGLIIYGSWVKVSVGGCFAAALLPAVITAMLFLIFLIVFCSVQSNITPPTTNLIPLGHAILATKDIWPILMLMASIMGTIYFGIATPTEAAGVGAVIALSMSVSFKTFSIEKLKDSLTATVRVSGMILFIMIGATILSVSLSVIGLPRQVVSAITATNMSPTLIIVVVSLLYLVLGCLFEGISLLVMTLPVVFPLMMSIGVDPYWLAVAIVILLEMGLLTPPVGMNLYVLQGVTQGEVSIGEVAKGSIPYFLLLGVALGLITAFPKLCTWLPYHMM